MMRNAGCNRQFECKALQQRTGCNYLVKFDCSIIGTTVVFILHAYAVHAAQMSTYAYLIMCIALLNALASHSHMTLTDSILGKVYLRSNLSRSLTD